MTFEQAPSRNRDSNVKFAPLVALAVVVAAVYFWNASWRVAPPDGEVQLIAHRGVHQTFARDGLTSETCTAERIHAPTHRFLENTLPSIEAAFEAGADVVEIDIHPTTDGYLAVFHDWTVDCRTEGTGVTRSHDLATLKALDIGFGYTADGGATFPLRGTGVGLMPELGEVFSAFPEGRFLVDFKGNETREGDMLAARLAENPEWRPLVWGVYGGSSPSLRARELVDGELRTFTRRGTMDCLIQYLGLGWTGFVPEPCRNATVMVPDNFAWLAWGWPNLFIERMREAGSEVILLGPYEAGDPGTTGIDTLEQLSQVPAEFVGYIWTNRIEVIGPAVRNDRPARD